MHNSVYSPFAIADGEHCFQLLDHTDMVKSMRTYFACVKLK